VSITRHLAGPVTLFLLLAGTGCGSPHAASPARPVARVAPTTAASADDGVAPATGTAADVNAADATAADLTGVALTGVDRSLDELDRDLADLGQALTQTQEGDVDQ